MLCFQQEASALTQGAFRPSLLQRRRAVGTETGSSQLRAPGTQVRRAPAQTPADCHPQTPTPRAAVRASDSMLTSSSSSSSSLAGSSRLCASLAAMSPHASGWSVTSHAHYGRHLKCGQQLPARTQDGGRRRKLSAGVGSAGRLVETRRGLLLPALLRARAGAPASSGALARCEQRTGKAERGKKAQGKTVWRKWTVLGSLPSTFVLFLRCGTRTQGLPCAEQALYH